VLAGREPQTKLPDTRSNQPTLAGASPGEVHLQDQGSTITVMWRDPTSGTVSFLVTGAHPGQEQAVMGKLGPGKTRLELHGLSTSLDYCFAVVAVYGPSTFQPSAVVCTERATKRPSADASK
jgi:hypothetical protein